VRFPAFLGSPARTELGRRRARSALINGAMSSRLLARHVLRRKTRQHPRAYHAAVLPNAVSPGAPEFQERAAAMAALVADLEAKLADARGGGGPSSLAKMRAKGKLTPRERCVYACGCAAAGGSVCG
jgi:hypothetical protein